jgi:DNA excision repair protein ERCC-4
MTKQPLYIVTDTREQKPYLFDRFPFVTTCKGTLPAGDYSLRTMENIVALERKALDDLISCLCHDRDRFERELLKLRGYALKAVVIEGSISDVSRKNYKSDMHPTAVLQSCLAFFVRYQVPFLFCETRRTAEYVTVSLLEKFVREQAKNLETYNSQGEKDHAEGKDPGQTTPGI